MPFNLVDVIIVFFKHSTDDIATNPSAMARNDSITQIAQLLGENADESDCLALLPFPVVGSGSGQENAVSFNPPCSSLQYPRDLTISIQQYRADSISPQIMYFQLKLIGSIGKSSQDSFSRCFGFSKKQ